MLTRELVLRTLRANLVPALRVIVPGPKTEFPLIRVSPDGGHSVVPDLEAAKSILPDGGFFMEMAQVSRVAKVRVRGFSAEVVAGESATHDGATDYLTADAADAGKLGSGSALDVAMRAAYCLGMDSAVVTVGFGSGESPGPTVLDVAAVAEREAPGSQTYEVGALAFLGAEVEYLRIDTGRDDPTPSLHKVWFSMDDLARDGGLGLPASLVAEALAAGDTWVSSPYPELRAALTPNGVSSGSSSSVVNGSSVDTPFCSNVPLATRLVFRGVPTPMFLRCLDRTVALLGMFLSPAKESRARHATPEGVLGAVRRPSASESFAIVQRAAPGRVTARRDAAQHVGSPGEVFEYLSVPSLLWFPEGLAATMSLAAAVTSHAEDLAKALKLREPVDLAANLRRQKAYYDADKEYFKGEMEALSALVAGLPQPEIAGNYSPDRGLREALRAVSHDRDCVKADLLDLRSAWGISEGSSRTGPVASQPARSTTCPVFGIMATEKPGGGHGKDKFGIETDRFMRMLRMAESMGMLAYVFFPDDDHGTDGASGYDSEGAWRSRPLIPAWVHRPWSGWVRRMAPVPDVVYDRHIPEVLPDGTTDDVAARFLGRFPHVKFINSLPFTHACRDKMKAHRILLDDPVCAAHLPVTIVLADVDSAVRFIASHETSFLKPLRGTGSKGLTVFRRFAECGESGSEIHLRVSQRQRDGGTADFEIHDWSTLQSLLRSIVVGEGGRLTGGEPRFVLQEGIRMARLPEGTGSTFEVRVIYQKGGLGKWRRTGMVCRINPGSERFIVPGKELHRRVDDVLGSAFPHRVPDIKERIRTLARRIPPLIEASSGYGGEMSIDLGIDYSGKPWLIEVNSKPATLFRDLGAFRLRELSFRRVLNFASSLQAKEVSELD